MKNLSYITFILCSMMLLFSSCSQEDPSSPVEEEKATLSFGAVINDLLEDQNLKQAVNALPECSDAAPSYVAIVLSGTTAVGSMADPLIVPINPIAGDYDNDGEEEYFTGESPDLELQAGSYSLDFFAVYDGADNLIWLAPAEGGDLSVWVNTLPMEFDLGAGVKKYLDVEVLCYDNSFANQYGYQFFELEPTEIIDFCLFGNVCDDNGTHIPVNFRFDVWTYSGDPEDPYGTPLFNENDPFTNTVGTNVNGDAYADPLCVFLPDTGGEDVYYGELYLIENGGHRLIRSGQFTDADVRSLYSGDSMDYYHFREGDCSMGDSPQILEETEGEEPAPVIDADTNIYIYVDASGSMFNAQYWLQWMNHNLLKDALISRYNNDEALYEEKVNFILDSSERTFDLLNLEGETPEGNVIVLVFQNEAEHVYHEGDHWDENTPRTEMFDKDIAALREKLETTNARYDGVIFQVEPNSGFNQESSVAYKTLIKSVEHGVGNYSGAYGLADRDEIFYVYDVSNSSANSGNYFVELIGNTLEDIGYDFW